MRGKFAIAAAVLAMSASAEQCGSVDLDVAFDEFDQIESWEAYHVAFERYGPCADGVVAGQFSEVASRLLALKWGIVEELAEVSDRNPKFLPFLLSMLGESVPEDEWRTITENARTRCPNAARRVCGALLGAM